MIPQVCGSLVIAFLYGTWVAFCLDSNPRPRTYSTWALPSGRFRDACCCMACSAHERQAQGATDDTEPLMLKEDRIGLVAFPCLCRESSAWNALAGIAQQSSRTRSALRLPRTMAGASQLLRKAGGHSMCREQHRLAWNIRHRTEHGRNCRLCLRSMFQVYRATVFRVCVKSGLLCGTFILWDSTCSWQVLWNAVRC